MASQSLPVVDCHPARQMVPPAGFSPLAGGGRHQRHGMDASRGLGSHQPKGRRAGRDPQAKAPFWQTLRGHDNYRSHLSVGPT